MTQESFLDIEEEFYNLENLELLHVEVFFNELALYFGSKQEFSQHFNFEALS